MISPRKAFLALIFSSATLACASNSPTTILPDNVILCRSNSGCFNKTLFGRNYQVLSTPRLTVMVSISTEGAYTRTDVSIANYSGLALNLTPDDFRVETVRPKSKIFTYILPNDLRDVAVSPPIPGPAVDGLQKENAPPNSQEPISQSPGMIAVSGTQSPESPQAPGIVAEAKQKDALQEAHDKAVAEQYLAAGWLAPNEVARGRVYFERDRHTRALNVVLPIAGLVFEFPYERNR